jgi:hypothetical protein
MLHICCVSYPRGEESLRTAATDGFIIHPPRDYEYGVLVEWYWGRKTEKLREKTCPTASLSNTNPTWTDKGVKPDIRGERQATNRLNHGTAMANICLNTFLNKWVVIKYVWRCTLETDHEGVVDEGIETGSILCDKWPQI